LLTLLTMAVIVHLGASLALSPVVEAQFLDADEQEYYRLAGDLLHGEYEFQCRCTWIETRLNRLPKVSPDKLKC